MKLKSLEIKGFKSFADRIVINFNDGVTGVVGPNGCGKSNVVDAMRWVLGEQKTKALRSEKMENVIFNGTQKRKAGNIAEVSLLLENTRNLLPTAYNEVRITRKLYRSGESEYQLNNVNCRLKDITNLFLDTGIGSDSYAIMELKMIDEILNDKDDSRRNLFEEASGVAKYKKRKKETLVKLDETQRNLDRVEDLLFELEKNLKTLQAQASRTEKYYKLKDIYKLKSLDLSFYTLQDFRDLTHKLEKNEQLLKDKRSEIEKRIAQNEAHIERLKLDIVEHEGLLASRQKATNKYVEEIRSFETEKKLRTEKLRMLEEREQTAKRQLQDDKSYVQLIENDCKKLRERVAQMLSQVNEADIALQKLKTKRDQSFDEHSSVKAKVNELRAAVVELQNTTHSLEKNAAINKIQVETLRNELARNASESDKRLEEVRGFTDEIKLVSKQL